jgi:phosphoglycerol transferase MdoB-like AlkP superfamily enzyme
LAIGFGAVALLHFQALRVGLWWCHRNLAAVEPARDVARAFLVGLRFDAAVAACLTVAVAALAALASLLRGNAGERRTYLGCALLAAPAIAVLGLAEIEFYGEFFARYNSLALHYWQQPATVLSMVWHGFPVIRYLLLAGAMAAAHVAAVAWLARRLAPDGAAAACRGWIAPARLAAVAGLLLLAARGGWQREPLDWGDAVHSRSQFANHLALNGLWSLGRAALAEARRDEPLERMWRAPLSLAVAEERMERILRPEPAARSVSLRDTGRPPNMVVILMESFSARFCGACGADASDDGYTPCFDRLAADGILFDRCLSAGTHTHQANVAVVAGRPNVPGHESLMEDATFGARPLGALPQRLADRGYGTWYLYNGDLAWENMRGFFRVQGIDRFVERADFPASQQFDSTWGPSDEELFRRANAELTHAPQPFYATICTMSNHEPFDLPRPLPFEPVSGQGVMDERLNGIRYADWAVGQFFEQARHEDYFRNTLFVLVGDHGFSVAPVLTELRLLRFHVPLLFYAPELLPRKGEVRRAVASQLDLVPTVLGLLGAAPADGLWGRDLFALPADDAGWAYFKPSEHSAEAGWAEGERLLVKTNDGQTKLYRFDLGFPAVVDPADDAALADRMDADLQAYLTAAAARLRSGPTAAH